MFRAILVLAVVGTLSAQNFQQNPRPRASTPVKPEDLGSISGQVTNAATGEPLKKTAVTALSAFGSVSALTDANGQFSLAGVAPGTYHLYASRNGFVRQEYGARGPERPGTALTVDKAQQVTAITLKLTPQSVITGRITDEDGDPVRAIVQVMRLGFNNQGRRQLLSAGTATANDLGEYRLYDIQGGKYYVTATIVSVTQTTASKDRYVPTYYPGVHDPSAATLIDVPAGVQMRGIDMTLRRAPTVAVRGKVVIAATNAPSIGGTVRLVTRRPSPPMTIGTATLGLGQTGAFEVARVPPGSYTIEVDSTEPGKRFTYRQPIEVAAAGVDALMITVPPPADLAGQVRLDGEGDVNLSRLTVSLRLRDTQGGSPNGKPKQDGSVTLEGVMPDNYELNISGLPAGYYVKSARLGTEEVLNAGLNLTSGAAGKLDIVISPAAAQVEGIVRDAKQEIARAVLVALIPDASRRSRTDLFKTAWTDDNGHYSIQGIPPGDYSLFAFEDIQSGAYYDPDFLKPLESSALHVALRENDHETRDLKEIPSTE